MTNENTGVRSPLGQPTQYFQTFDLGCCAALVSLGFKLVSLEKQSSGRVQFVIERSAVIDSAIEKYWDDQLEVRARSYFDALKMLKTRLYSL